MHTILAVIDVQNDFLSGGSLAVPDGDSVIPYINTKIDEYSRSHLPVLYSMDWHSPDTKHFAMFNPDGEGWPVHCVVNTEGVKLSKELVQLPSEQAFYVFKGIPSGLDEDGYSLWTGRTHEGRDPHEVLQERHVDTVYIVGLALDYCVLASALGAVEHGYTTIVDLKGTRAVNLNPNDGDNAIEKMKIAGVKIVS